MASYSKTASGQVKPAQLQGEINNDTLIGPKCSSITFDKVTLALDLDFVSSLSAADETQLDILIASHAIVDDQISVAQLPLSGLDGKKLAVHPSYKPTPNGTENFAVWAGAGDEINASTGNLVDGGEIGGGPLLCLNMTASVVEVSQDVKFHPDNGAVWLHEAYIKFANASEGDYVTGEIRAEATPLQTSVNLDLEVGASSWIIPASAGAGNGTHGWADASKIVLVPRTFSKDGEWDYDGTNLTPNASSTGGYRLSTIDRAIHRYVNRIPCMGSVPYFSITSDETTKLPPNYYIRISCRNESGQTFAQAWDLCVILEIYRERTHKP